MLIHNQPLSANSRKQRVNLTVPFHCPRNNQTAQAFRASRSKAMPTCADITAAKVVG
jgi:hypothetical protein